MVGAGGPGYTFNLGTWDGRWDGALLMSPSLIQGGGPAYLREFYVQSGGLVRMRLAVDQTAFPFDTGPQINDPWDTFANAITLTSSNGSSITVAGGDWPGNTFRDPDEPYFFIPANNDALEAWSTAAMGTTVWLTLDDGVIRGSGEVVEAEGLLGEAEGRQRLDAEFGEGAPITGVGRLAEAAGEAEEGAYQFDLGTWTGDWRGNLPINQDLVDVAEGRNLRRVSIVPGSRRVRISTGLAPDTEGPGYDLSTDWENFARAVTLISSNGTRVTYAGPANSGNTFTDLTDAYFWEPANWDEINTWNTGAQGTTVQIVLSDGQAGEFLGEGAPIDAVGSLGEAEGEELIQGAGASITAEGSLGEAEGLALPIHGEGAPVAATGAIGEAEGYALPIHGEGAALEATGALGGAIGEAEQGAHQFNIGTWAGDWRGNLPISQDLVDDSVTAGRNLRRVSVVPSQRRFRISTGQAPDTEGPNYDLSTEWEGFERAVTLISSNGTRITLAGPDNSGNVVQDPTDAYFWEPANFDDLNTWNTNAMGTQVQVILSDGQAGEFIGEGAPIVAEGVLAEGIGHTPVHGAGAPVDATGALGEAEGIFNPIHGEAAPIEATGDVGEAEGFVPVFGDGAAIEATAALGEAEGIAYGPVEAEGAPVDAEGAIGEADGVHYGTVPGEGAPIDGVATIGGATGIFNPLHGEGAPIEATGGLGGAEGVHYGPVFGAGAPIDGRGSLGDAYGTIGDASREPVNLQLYVNFTGALTGAPPDSQWENVTSVVSASDLVFDCISGTQEHRYAPDLIRVRLQQSRNATLVGRIRRTRRLGALLYMHGTPVWRGFILPGKAQRVDDQPNLLEIEGVDHAERLRVACQAIDYRDRTVREIVTALIRSVPGVADGVADDTLLSFDSLQHANCSPELQPTDGSRLGITVEHFARKPGEATVLDLADRLLTEYGYILYAKSNGYFGVRSWWYSSGEYSSRTDCVPERRIDDDFMQAGLEGQHRDTAHESVAVEWSVVADQQDALLYRENLPIGSDGELVGALVLAGTYFPILAQNEAIWQEYRTDWLVGTAGRGEDVDLLYAENQRVVIDADPDIQVATQFHEPLRSRVALRNTGSDDTRRLRIFDIRGDATFRSQTRVTLVTAVPPVTGTVIAPATGGASFTLSGTDVSTVDGTYTGWTVVIRGLEAIIGSYGPNRLVTLAMPPGGWSLSHGDSVTLRPPADGDTNTVRATSIFDATSARRYAVALKDDILIAESFLFSARYADAPLIGPRRIGVGDFVQIIYPTWGLEGNDDSTGRVRSGLCVVRQRSDQSGAIPGGEPHRVDFELMPVRQLEESEAFPGPTLQAAGLNVQQGAPGRTTEEIFAVTTMDHGGTLPEDMRPSNAWGYRTPGTIGGLQWSIGQPSVNSTTPFAWRAVRGVSGYPSDGTAISDDWEAPTIVSRYGDDGVPGDRGSTFIAHELSSGNTWASAVAVVDGGTYSGGDAIATQLAAFGGGPQPNDYVTLYRGAYTETRVWDGLAWATVDAFLHGNLVVEGSIIGNRLAANTVTAREIASNTITAAQIKASTITSTELASNSVTADEITVGAVGSSELQSDSVGSSELINNAVGTVHIANGAVTANEIRANTITAGELAANSVTASEISANSVDTSELVAGAVTANEIRANTITASEIQGGTITRAEIQAGTITNAEIQNGTITGTEIASSTITNSHIVAGTITDAEIQNGTITNASIQNGTITGAKIQNATITADKLHADVLTAIVADVSASLSVGDISKFQAGGSGTPTTGANRAFLDMDEVGIERWTGSRWERLSTLSVQASSGGEEGNLRIGESAGVREFLANQDAFGLLQNGRNRLILSNQTSIPGIEFYDTSGVLQGWIYYDPTNDRLVFQGAEVYVNDELRVQSAAAFLSGITASGNVDANGWIRADLGIRSVSSVRSNGIVSDSQVYDALIVRSTGNILVTGGWRDEDRSEDVVAAVGANQTSTVRLQGYGTGSISNRWISRVISRTSSTFARGMFISF